VSVAERQTERERKGRTDIIPANAALNYVARPKRKRVLVEVMPTFAALVTNNNRPTHTFLQQTNTRLGGRYYAVVGPRYGTCAGFVACDGYALQTPVEGTLFDRGCGARSDILMHMPAIGYRTRSVCFWAVRDRVLNILKIC